MSRYVLPYYKDDFHKAVRCSSRRGVIRRGGTERGRQGRFCAGLQKGHFQSVLGRPVVAVGDGVGGGSKLVL